MTGLREYILCVVAAAMLVSLLTELVSGCKAKELLRILSALILCFVMVRPLSSLEWTDFTLLSGTYTDLGRELAQTGERAGRKAAADIIKAQTEAYILDKAAALKADLTVEVLLSEHNVPDGAILSGSISPYARQQLEAKLETELGIPKENQQWNG